MGQNTLESVKIEKTDVELSLIVVRSLMRIRDAAFLHVINRVCGHQNLDSFASLKIQNKIIFILRASFGINRIL